MLPNKLQIKLDELCSIQALVQNEQKPITIYRQSLPGSRKRLEQKKILPSRCSFFEKRPKTFFARFYFPENENLIFDAISNSGKRRVTPKLKFLSLSRRIPSGVQSNSFSQFESQDSGSSDRWSVSMHRLWRLRSDREEPKSKSKRSPRGKKKLKELPLERQKKTFLSLIRRGMHLRYFYN